MTIVIIIFVLAFIALVVMDVVIFFDLWPRNLHRKFEDVLFRELSKPGGRGAAILENPSLLIDAYKSSHVDDMCPNCTCIHNHHRVLCMSCEVPSAKPIMLTQEQLDKHRCEAKRKPPNRRPLGIL